MCVCVCLHVYVLRPTLSLTHLVLVGSVGLWLCRRTITEETYEHAPFALAVVGVILKQ